jgi:hypothetical protein
LKSNVCDELPDVAVIVMMWLPAGVPVEVLPPPLGLLPLPPPQAQIAKANSGTNRQRSRGALTIAVRPKYRMLRQSASSVSPVVKTIGMKSRDLAVVWMTSSD